ncbi:hypothetical protein Tco_1430334 [Tanacetum coccineum]
MVDLIGVKMWSIERFLYVLNKEKAGRLVCFTFRVFGALCYPTNNSKDLGKLQPTSDIGIFVGYAPSKKGYRIIQTEKPTYYGANGSCATQYRTRSYFYDAWTNKFRARTKSGSCSTLCTPTNKELEILFQPMFDEYLEPPRVERPVSPAPAVSVPVNSAGTPSSTTIDQDAILPSHSPSIFGITISKFTSRRCS